MSEGRGRLLRIRTWTDGEVAEMLTSWACGDSDAVALYVLQRYERGAWQVERSWDPSERPIASALARRILQGSRE